MTPAIHATCVARHGREGWRAVLLRGPSGIGKSDLALRLIGRGWRLVSDDYCHIWQSGGVAFAAAPPRLADRLEARGLGIVASAAVPSCRVVLIVDCQHTTPERLPEAEVETLAGVAIERLRFQPLLVSAVDLVEAAMRRGRAGL